jgi:hypothetical protein
MLLAELAWRIDEHTLYLGPIVRLPTIRLPPYLRSLVEDWVECSHGLRFVDHQWGIRYEYLRRVVEGGVSE